MNKNEEKAATGDEERHRNTGAGKRSNTFLSQGGERKEHPRDTMHGKGCWTRTKTRGGT